MEVSQAIQDAIFSGDLVSLVRLLTPDTVQFHDRSGYTPVGYVFVSSSTRPEMRISLLERMVRVDPDIVVRPVRYGSRWTPLAKAISAKDARTTCWLLEHGADLLAAGPTSGSLFNYLVSQNDVSLLQAVLQCAKLAPDQLQRELQARDPVYEKEIAPSVAAVLQRAIAGESMEGPVRVSFGAESAEQLLDLVKATAVDRIRATPAHVASSATNALKEALNAMEPSEVIRARIRALADTGMDWNNVVVRPAMSALESSIRFRPGPHKEVVVSELLRAGVDPNVRHMSLNMRHNRTALDWAVMEDEHPAITSLLMERATPDTLRGALDELRAQPLLSHSQRTIAEVLLTRLNPDTVAPAADAAAGAAWVDVHPGAPATLDDYADAIMAGNLAAVAAAGPGMVELNEAAMRSNPEQMGPMRAVAISSSRNAAKMVALLAELGADPNLVVGTQNTPLILALTKDDARFDVLDALIAAGARDISPHADHDALVAAIHSSSLRNLLWVLRQPSLQHSPAQYARALELAIRMRRSDMADAIRQALAAQSSAVSTGGRWYRQRRG